MRSGHHKLAYPWTMGLEEGILYVVPTVALDDHYGHTGVERLQYG